MENLRRIEKKNDNNEWIVVDFSELRKGDTFRMFEPTGEPVVQILDSDNSRTDFLATSDLFKDKNSDQWMIEV